MFWKDSNQMVRKGRSPSVLTLNRGFIPSEGLKWPFRPYVYVTIAQKTTAVPGDERYTAGIKQSSRDAGHKIIELTHNVKWWNYKSEGCWIEFKTGHFRVFLVPVLSVNIRSLWKLLPVLSNPWCVQDQNTVWVAFIVFVVYIPVIVIHSI